MFIFLIGMFATALELIACLFFLIIYWDEISNERLNLIMKWIKYFEIKFEIEFIFIKIAKLPN